MTRISLTSFTLATVCVTALAVTAPARSQEAAPPVQIVTNGPQFTAGDGAGPAGAERNVRESAQYDALLHTNPAFRAVRIQKECGPISEPQLRAACIASFDTVEDAQMGSRYRRYSKAAD